MKTRITCVLGAGAMIPVGGPRVDALTKAVCNTRQFAREQLSGRLQEVRFLERIASRLNTFLSPDECNFEDMLHVLETLDSYRTGWHETTTPAFRPRPAAFLSPRDLDWFDRFALQSGKIDIVRTVAEQVAHSVESFKPETEHKWFQSFWRQAFDVADWDLATLNYDDLFERIALEYEDGYEQSDSKNCVPFEAGRIWSSSRLRILHLHGSILFGYSHPTQTGLWSPSFHDLWKFRDTKSAQQTWFNRSVNRAQANEDAIIGPIITGLRKPDKLTVEPYREYQEVLSAAMRQSSRLLVIGYSFGDLYLNNILNRLPVLHKEDRRIVFVTFFGDPNLWHPDPRVISNRWINNRMFEFLAQAMHSERPLGDSLNYNAVLKSDDGRCRVYLDGTQPALEKHGQEILEFLTN
jgi:hypothetical protein